MTFMREVKEFAFFYHYHFLSLYICKEGACCNFVNFHGFFSPLDLSEGGAPRVPGPQLRG